MSKIFISYRRKDWAFAQMLAQHIDNELYNVEVFIDFKVDEPDFRRKILREIRDCDIFLLVVSERTFDENRIHKSDDWIRREISEALQHDKLIVLAAIEECTVPEDLPEDIKKIRDIQAIIFHPEMFEDCVRRLAEWCLKLAPHIFRVDKSVQGIHQAKLNTREQTGIDTTFDNLVASAPSMIQDFKHSSNIRMLLQLGRRELGSGGASIFYPIVKQKDSSVHIRVLHASMQSPFLSEARAIKRGVTSIEEWHQAIESIKKYIHILRERHNTPIEEREHSEPFLWRIFLFDDVAYVSGYLFGRENDEKSVVHKILKGSNSLFGVFDNYFEYLWEKYKPNENRGEIEKWKDW